MGKVGKSLIFFFVCSAEVDQSERVIPFFIQKIFFKLPLNYRELKVVSHYPQVIMENPFDICSEHIPFFPNIRVNQGCFNFIQANPQPKFFFNSDNRQKIIPNGPLLTNYPKILQSPFSNFDIFPPNRKFHFSAIAINFCKSQIN